MLKRLIIGVVAGAACLATTFVAAADFPNRPVRIVVPYPAGGPVDNFTRALADKLSLKWGKPVVVDNRPGGNELVGGQLVANAAPDGYTLLMGADASLSLAPYIVKKMPYETTKAFAPISHLLTFNLAYFVSAQHPANTLQQYIALARQNPGKFAFGSPGSLQFLYAEFANVTKIEQIVVPYPGLAPIIPDTIAGRIHSSVGALSVVEPHVTAGKLKVLAVGGARRSTLLPNVPTFAEAGLPEVDATFFAGLVAPAGTSRDIINMIARDAREVVSAADFRQKNLEPFALELVASTPEAFSEFLAANRQRQATRVKLSGFEPQ